jgi:hypothetical protein
MLKLNKLATTSATKFVAKPKLSQVRFASGPSEKGKIKTTQFKKTKP